MEDALLRKLVDAINETTNSARDLQELLRAVLRELMEIPDSQYHSIAIIDSDRDLVVRTYRPEGHAILNFELAQEAIQTRKVKLWTAQSKAREDELSADFANLQSALYAPLVSRNEPLGVICIATARQNSFLEQAAVIRILESLAGVIASHVKKYLPDHQSPLLPSAFISYAREDTAWVTQFAGDLRRRQIKVWYDKYLKSEPGENYQKLIEEAIKTKNTFVVVMSEHSESSEAVATELKLARQFGKQIIPVKCQNNPTPEWVNANQLQYLNFWNDYAASLNALVQKLRQKSQNFYGLTNELSQGYMLGGVYRLERLLGKGGMGEVWLATHTLVNELRAIKVLPKNYQDDAKLRERFIYGEGRNALKLRPHDNIVRIFEVSIYQNMPYIVMEYVESGPAGSDFKQLLKTKGRLSIADTNDFLQQIGGALQAAHDQKLIHRDVKPANIMIDKAGQAKLTDFGLIKDLEAASDMTANGIPMGTPSYMAPEQAEGKAGISSDIYSLGVVIYEALTGRVPFIGDNFRAVIFQHLTAAPPPLRQFAPNIPLEIEEVVLRTLAKNPAERFATVNAFMQAFQQIVQNSVATDTVITNEFTLASASTAEQSEPTLPSNNQAPLSQPKVEESVSGYYELIKEAIPSNLPSPATSFIGRETELSRVQELLQNTRLLTLMGAGGTGKTRLSLETGNAVLAQYKDGVWFVELAPVSDPKLIEQTVNEILGVKEEAGQTSLNLLRQHLSDKQILLILDNCEHLVESVAKLVDKLLPISPRLKVLATSREALNISGETTWRVPSLAVPTLIEVKKLSPEQLSQYEAVRLFLERAKAAKPEFQITENNAEAIAKICHQLEGIPLAIELAAARVRLMSAEDLLKRLDEPFKLLRGGSRTASSRQQTLEALIRWSYDLLPIQEQILWARLSVFVGSWSLEAAENICIGDFDGGSIEDFEIMDLLEQLINKSLVLTDEQNGTMRYKMLESIREFGKLILEQKVESSDLQARHANWFVELVEKAEPELMGAAQKEWLNRLEADYTNIRAALAWAVSDKAEPTRIETALRISGSLWLFWSMQGYFREARQWLDKALQAASSPTISEQIAKNSWYKALNAAGVITHKQGDYEGAKKYYEDGLNLARKNEDKGQMARFLSNLGVANRHLGNVQLARSLYSESLALCRELKIMQGVGYLLNNLGLIARDLGDYIAAETYIQESITLQQSLNDKNGIALAICTLADILIDQQKYKEASIYLKQSLQVFYELKNQELIAYCLEYIGAIAAAFRKPERAAQLIGAAAFIRREIETPLSLIEQNRLEKRLESAKTQLSTQKWLDNIQAGQKMALDIIVKSALELIIEQ